MYETGKKHKFEVARDVPVQAWIRRDVQATDILAAILRGAPAGACVRLSTFSVAEESLRSLWRIRKEFAVGEMRVLIDRKATLKTHKLANFVNTVFDSALLSDIHAKVMIVTWPGNAAPPVAVVTSQNLTRGGRFESSVMLSDIPQVHQLAGMFDDIERENSVPVHEVFHVT
ncbi:MAG: hypothetical protein K2O24_00840 [Muribaculaceae bacterium]|nr:hypothetical protein [Muribaculaceae bacterium]